MRDKSEAPKIERLDAADKREDAVHAKLSITSWELTACAKVREVIISGARYDHRMMVIAEDAAGILVHHNGVPVRIRVEPLSGVEREAIHFGLDRGHEAPDAAGSISSPPADSAAINSAVTA